MRGQLLFTVSGLRGVVGEALTPDVVITYTEALVRLLGPGLYVLATDTRPHRQIVASAALSALLAAGADVLDLSIAPTPTALFTIRQKGANGGVIATASHNPVEWNALKFARGGGVFLFAADVERMRALLQEPPRWSRWNAVGKAAPYPEAIHAHIREVVSSPWVEDDWVRGRRFQVAVDCVNGAMYRALPGLLEALGCQVHRLYCEPTGLFPHNPEPRKAHLKELDELLVEGGAEIGFATDPDGDRLVVGLRRLGVLSEEYTVPLAIWGVLKRKPGPVVVNYSTSMLVEDVARRFEVPVYRAPVGEANVVEKMRAVGAVIGGEGNGGVIFPEINLTRDGIVGAGLILSTFAGIKDPTDWVASLPRYALLKERVPHEGPFDPEPLIRLLSDAEIVTEDGVYARYPDRWVHVRPSNTEPIIRIYAEAPREAEAAELVSRVREALTRPL